MENHVKMLITEQAAEFHREDAKILNDYGFDLHFCQMVLTFTSAKRMASRY